MSASSVPIVVMPLLPGFLPVQHSSVFCMSLAWPEAPTLCVFFSSINSVITLCIFMVLVRGTNTTYTYSCCCSAVVFNSLWPHGLQHTSLPCPSLYPRVCSNSHPLSQWCHPTISSSVVPFSSCPQSFQHQGLCQRVGSLHQVGKVLELQLQH